MADIGGRIKRLRQERKLSLRALGKLANLSHSFIADIEQGRSKPSIDTLSALAKALGISRAELLREEPSNDLSDLGITNLAAHMEGQYGREASPELKALIREIVEEVRAEVRAEEAKKGKDQGKGGPNRGSADTPHGGG